MTADARRARTAFVWVGVIVPLGVIILAAVVVLSWLPQIPDPSAIHWSTDGVDGYGPRWSNLAVLLGFGGGTVALLAALTLSAHRLPQNRRRTNGEAVTPQWSATARLLGAMNLGLSIMISTLTLASVGVQRGLADAADAPDISPWAFLSLGLLAAFALMGWLLQPATHASERGDGRHSAQLHADRPRPVNGG